MRGSAWSTATAILNDFRRLSPFDDRYRRIIGQLGQTRDPAAIEALEALLPEHLGPGARRKVFDWVLEEVVMALETCGWNPTDPLHRAARYLVLQDWRGLAALGGTGHACLWQMVEKRRANAQDPYSIATVLAMAETGDPEFIPVLAYTAQSVRDHQTPVVQAIENLLERAAERASAATLATAAKLEGIEIWSELRMWEGEDGTTYSRQPIDCTRIRELARNELHRRDKLA